MTDRSKTVVMLIDWDNLQICHSRDAPGTELDLQALIALAQSYGTLVSARAYAEWNLLSERLAIYKAGIEPVFAPVLRPENSPREGKSLADTVMVADGVDLLWTVAPDVFVLATSDKDMIPLARIAKQRGAAVVILGSDLTAIPLVEISNVFITYRQLLRELDRVSELEAPVGRAPARERRLREARRPVSEPYSGVFGNTGGIGQTAGFGGGRGPARGPGNLPPSLGPGQAPPIPPTRRIQPAPLPAEVAAPLASSTAATAATNGPVAEAPTESSGSGLAEPGARRRRRRGGRGRRVGFGEGGDTDSTTDSLHEGDDDSNDEAEDTDVTRPVAAVPPTSPDEIDNAVLRLLAAQDRDAAPSGSRDTAAPAPAEPPAESFSAPSLASTSDAPPPAPRRRMVRTSFSSFGPPDGATLSRARSAEESAPSTPSSDAAPQSMALVAREAPSADTGLVDAGSPAEEESQPTAASASSTSDSGDANAASASATPSTGESPAESASDAASSDEQAPPKRTRSSRSGSTRSSSTRRTRRTSANSDADSSTGAADSADGGESSTDEAARPVRRRRVRRPTRATADTATESSEGGDTAGDSSAGGDSQAAQADAGGDSGSADASQHGEGATSQTGD